MKKLFVAATRQNDGKTSVSVGLFRALQRRFSSIAYMKPVGQQYKVIDGQKIDKDAVLFKTVYDLKDSLADMSPIAVPPGFTEAYLNAPNAEALHRQIQTAFTRLSQGKELVLIEGTGHGGVGAVFDTSNGDVAKLLDAPVVLVTLGGIGKSMDELLLNKAFFESRGARIMGVIINKVQDGKQEKIHRSLSVSLARNGLPLLGMIPFVNMLTKPSISELIEDLEAKLLCGEEYLSNQINKVVIGAMLPHDAMDYFTEDTLLIVPANREDLIITALCSRLMTPKPHYDVSAIILTGGIGPHPKILELVKQSKIPLMLVEKDSFSVATKINKMLFKLRSEETEKLATIQSLVESHVDLDAICAAL